MAHYIERCAALYMHLICTGACICMRFITVKNIYIWCRNQGTSVFGIRNKYCSVCAISARNNVTAPSHQCFRNWSCSSCSMEADIILEGFQQSENMHGLRYLWLIGDGDSSVYHSVETGVPSYGHEIAKVECANHTVNCYRNRLEALCNDKPLYHCTHGLSKDMMK